MEPNTSRSSSIPERYRQSIRITKKPTAPIHGFSDATTTSDRGVDRELTGVDLNPEDINALVRFRLPNFLSVNFD